VGQIFCSELRGLDVDGETIFSGSGRRDGAEACYYDARKDVAEVVRVEELCEVFDRGWTRECDAVAAAGEYCAEATAIEVLGEYGLVSGDDIDSCAGLFQCFRQDFATNCGAWQQNVETAQVFVAAGEFAQCCEHAFSG